MTPAIVALGTSLGGLHALQTVLPGLPPEFPAPLAIVQHRGKGEESGLALLLQEVCRLPLCEPEDKQRLQPGRVYVAPSDYHLLVERGGCLSLSTDGPIQHARPSIDALFESAARAYGARAVAVVLTGASADGARGAARIKALGGVVVVQDPATAESAVMPKAALAAVRADRVLPLAQIAAFLVELCADQGTSP